MSTYANPKGVTSEDVDQWILRINEVTEAVAEFINEDPAQAEQQRDERERRRRELEREQHDAQLAERRRRIKERYDTRYYSRLEDDAVIERMLADADNSAATALNTLAAAATSSSKGGPCVLSNFERISLEEANRLKDCGAAAARAGNWELAREHYSRAITLDVVDDALARILRNNRALANNKLARYGEAVEDATVVLQGRGDGDGGAPDDIKALLRRAFALARLHRPEEADADVQRVLSLQPGNTEAASLRLDIAAEKADMDLYRELADRDPDASRKVDEAVSRLLCHTDRLSEALRRADGAPRAEVLEWVDLCQEDMGVLLPILTGERGGCILLHQRGGTRAIARLLHEVATGVAAAGSPLAGATSGALLLAVGFRLVALVLASSELARTTLPADEVERAVVAAQRCCGLAGAGDGAGDLPPDGALTVHEDLRVAALQLLGSIAKGDAARSLPARHSREVTALLQGYAQRPVSSVFVFTAKWLAALLSHAPSAERLLKGDEAGAVDLPDVIERTLAVPGQSAAHVETALAVALPLTTAAGGAEAFDAPLRRLLRPSFTALLGRQVVSLTAAAVRCDAAARPHGLDTGSLEAVYAILYNLAVRTPAKERYARELAECSILASSWNLVTSYAAGNGAGAAGPAASAVRGHVVPLALGLVVKLCAAHPPTLAAVARDVDVLWGALHAARRATADAPPAAGRAALPEHAALGLATVYLREAAAREAIGRDDGGGGGAAAEVVRTLLWHIRGATTSPTTVGNLALLVSWLPPSAHPALVANDAMRVLLEALRATRAAIHTREHASAATGVPDAALPSYRSAQTNLSIAISKCCASAALLDRLRDLRGFETLHAVIGRRQPA